MDKTLDHRVSRRRVLAILVTSGGATVGLPLLAACAPTAAPPAATKPPAAAPTAAPAPTQAPPPPTQAPAAAAATKPPAVTDTKDPAAAKIDWQQAKGAKIKMLSVKMSYTDFLQPLLPEFEKLTGISASLEALPEDQFISKLQVDLASGKSAYDVFPINWVTIAQYAGAGWVEPLEPYINDANLTDKAWFDPDDFPAAGRLSGTYKSKWYGLAITGGWQILFYRKDLFQAKGLKVPKTMDEMYEAAKALKTSEVAGMVNRLARGVGTPWPYAGYVRSYGTYWVDPNGTVGLDTDQGIAATDMYVKLLRDAGPPGVLNFGFAEAYTSFQQGKAAMFTDINSFFARFEDKEKSTVVGKTGYATLPAGPGGKSVPNINYWTLGMSSTSPNKKAAWLFIEWATAKKTLLNVSLNTGSVPRKSTFGEPEFKAKYNIQDWLEACAAAADAGDPFALPQTAAYNKLADVLDVTMQTIFQGADTKKEMTAAANKMRDILKQT